LKKTFKFSRNTNFLNLRRFTFFYRLNIFSLFRKYQLTFLTIFDNCSRFHVRKKEKKRKIQSNRRFSKNQRGKTILNIITIFVVMHIANQKRVDRMYTYCKNWVHKNIKDINMVASFVQTVIPVSRDF